MTQSILNRIALRENVAPCFLSIVGVQDESKTVGKILYHVNVEDEQHAKYCSTVCFMVNAK